jgi:hypothetical protein
MSDDLMVARRNQSLLGPYWSFPYNLLKFKLLIAVKLAS